MLGDDADARAIVARTEGWPAAVYLVACGCARAATPTELPTQHLSEYLTTEVLAGLERRRARSSSSAPPCSRACPPSCATTCSSRDDSADRLAALVRANLFLVALDEHDGWFRCHDLVRELLRRSLPAEDGGDRWRAGPRRGSPSAA